MFSCYNSDNTQDQNVFAKSSKSILSSAFRFPSDVLIYNFCTLMSISLHFSCTKDIQKFMSKLHLTSKGL